jgi:hypothetical protein
MIVRIFGENQYRVPDELRERLNQFDNECVTTAQAGDEERFRACYAEMLALVRSSGEALDDDELEGSDVMLPPADITIDEAQTEFTGDGLIPE